MINRNRLAETFDQLVRIDSISKEEARLAATLKVMLEDLGARVEFDDVGETLGGDCGNLIARFPGTTDAPPLLLNAHLDTVEPGRGIVPVLADGVFTSAGETILGADDKSALAALLESLRVIRENDLPHGPLEVVLTVCEEIGLRGAKHFDVGRITATYGYALDASDPEGIVNRAPGANRFTIEIHGKDAHAGAAPETGINAIWLAGKAIAELPTGRIDPETTCNIGLIEGGKATNIVPDRCTFKGEVRSHDEATLEGLTDRIFSTVRSVIEAHRSDPDAELPRVEMELSRDFARTHIPEDHPVIDLARRAAANLGRELIPKTTGGGADANIFFGHGVAVGVLGTGMRDMHSVRESIRLDDLVKTAELVVEIVRLQAEARNS